MLTLSVLGDTVTGMILCTACSISLPAIAPDPNPVFSNVGATNTVLALAGRMLANDVVGSVTVVPAVVTTTFFEVLFLFAFSASWAASIALRSAISTSLAAL